MRSRLLVLGHALGVIALLALAAGPTTAPAADFGKAGSPIHLVVGHPCCYAEVWSAMALRGKQLWKKYLPPGSTVDFEIGLQGSTIVNSMLAGKALIGYVGDLPAIAATTKRNIADLRIVAVTGVAPDQCNILLVRKDAPKFASASDAVRWLNGKQFGVPKGTCSDIFSKTIFKRENAQPASYLNQNVEVITSNFRAGKIDGAAIWEPIAARLVDEGLARRIASGANYGLKDSSYLLMNADLITQRPDVVKGWLNAELDAQRYLSDPAHASEMIQMVMTQTTGFPERALWDALYATYPPSEGGSNPRMELPFGFTSEVMQLISKGTAFLHSIKAIGEAQMLPDAVMPKFTEEVLKERGLTSPVGSVPALPPSAYHGK